MKKTTALFFPSIKLRTLFFAVGFFVLHAVALTSFDPLYIGAFFSFFFVVLAPGMLFLPFLTQKKMPPPLGLAFSATLSIFLLMFSGLILNTILPLYGVAQPLTTIPLLITFDLVFALLLLAHYFARPGDVFEKSAASAFSWMIGGVSLLVPVLAVLGAIRLNNGGSDIFTMLALLLIALIVILLIFARTKVSVSLPPFVLYTSALGLLFMNSMRGWFVTGHDILLEYHVFSITNTAHLWNMAFYHDPYMACLSLTILPTYLQSFIHVDPAYIFKFFMQFIGAVPVVVIYYLTKEYIPPKFAFLASFIFITFPTYMVDMAFLNRQGMAFLFFGCMLYVLFNPERYSGWRRYAALFIFGGGMIVSHYSTSYIAVPMLLTAYVINRLLRLVMRAKRPRWFASFTESLPSKDAYQGPILLTLPFVVGLLILMVVWSTFITKTSNNLINTLNQIATTLEHPFSLDAYSGPAKYSLVQSKQATADVLFDQFQEQGKMRAAEVKNQSEFYPTSITDEYKATPVAEVLVPLTALGQRLQSLPHVNLANFYAFAKQAYAKTVQIFLLIGLAGLGLGYGFKRNLLKNIPSEYLSMSLAGIAIIVGQTILPTNAIDYGLLRLFQQNLVLLVLPVVLGLFFLSSFVTRNHTGRLFLCCAVILGFYGVLSGFVPQLTGGGRPPLTLNNYGLYYESYYMHAEEVYAMSWIAKYADRELPIQAAHFSDIKMVAYGTIQPHIELLPATIRKNAYAYLNYDNTKTHKIVENVNSDILFYYFPISFLDTYKNLVYNNGGSELYR